MESALVIQVFGNEQSVKKLDAVNECIFCRASSENKKLTDEHLIPDGIAGHLILPQATCIVCLPKLNRFEQPVIKSHFGMTRHLRKISSKKKRKKSYQSGQQVGFFPASVPKGGFEKLGDTGIDPRQLEGLSSIFDDGFILEDYGMRPGILCGLSELECADVWRCKLVVPLHGRGQGNPPPFSLEFRHIPGLLEKFVAKIAHCTAVGALGIGSFEPWLDKFIIDPERRPNAFLIGTRELNVLSSANTGFPIPPLHRVYLYGTRAQVSHLPGLPSAERSLVTCLVHLFADRNKIAYEVVTGAAKEETWAEELEKKATYKVPQISI